MSCDLCHKRGWFFYLNRLTGLTEIRRCDVCDFIPIEEQAGEVAKRYIEVAFSVASKMTEVRKGEDCITDIICSHCACRSWIFQKNENHVTEIRKCNWCSIFEADQQAAEIAMNQIANAFDLVFLAEEIRQDDEKIRDATARAFGESPTPSPRSRT